MPGPTDPRSALTRRSFLELAAPLALAWPLAVRTSAAAATIPIAVQLYSVRDDCKADFDAALAQVAAMGFAGVEFAGYYGYADRGPDLRKRLDALGLKVAGTHIQLATLQGDALKKTIDFHQAIGCRFLVVPGNPDFTNPEKSKALADTFNELAATLKPLKMACGYHNHIERVQEGRRQDVLGPVRRADDEGRHPAAGLRLDVRGRASTRSST